MSCSESNRYLRRSRRYDEPNRLEKLESTGVLLRASLLESHAAFRSMASGLAGHAPFNVSALRRMPARWAFGDKYSIDTSVVSVVTTVGAGARAW